MQGYLISGDRHSYFYNANICLREFCDKRVKEIYGEVVPQEISNRIDWELDAINRMEMDYVFLFLKELMEKNELLSNDIMLRGACSCSFVLYLCGISNYNPLDYGLTPYFAFGIGKDKRIDIDVNVPVNVYEQVRKSCKILEDVVHIFPSNDAQLSCNLLRRLDISPESIRLDDSDVLSLFNIPNIFGTNSEETAEIKYGVLGLSEFKSPIAINMLDDVKIASFCDVYKIYGLLHGTDTWLGNAEQLIRENKAFLRDVISSYEDVFDYLLSKGIKGEDAFRIADRVRKGLGVSNTDKELMYFSGVTEWYIDSCQKIKYLLPRTQCISYTLNLWRRAYFKLNNPKEFYEEYFKVHNYGELNKVIESGYQQFCIYRENGMHEYNPMNENEKNHKEYMRQKYGLLVANEMYGRIMKGMNIDN